MSKFTYTHLETGEILYSIIDIGSCVGKYLFTTSLGTKKIVHSSKVHKSKSYIYPMTEGYNCYNNDNDPNIKGVITNLQQFDNLYKWFQNKGKDWQCYIKDGGDYQGAITCNNTPSTATDVNILPKGAQGNNNNSTDVSHCKNVCSIITDCCGFTYGEFQSEESSTYACNLFTGLKQSVNKQCAQRKEEDPWSVVYVRHPAPPPIKPTPVPNLKYKPSPNVNCYDKNQGGTVTTEVSSNYPGDDKPFYQLLQWFLHQPPEGSKDGPEYGANKTCWRGTTYQKKQFTTALRMEDYVTISIQMIMILIYRIPALTVLTIAIIYQTVVDLLMELYQDKVILMGVIYLQGLKLIKTATRIAQVSKTIQYM